MSIIYLISGLGADRRMFQYLKLPEHMPKHYIDWIAPIDIDEPLAAYVQRLKPQITDPNPILIGLSFGGVVAIELAKILQPRKIIIISSLATRFALPWYYRAMGKLKLHRWVPLKILQSGIPFAPWFFGAQTPPHKMLLRNVILEIDELFLRWSLGQLLSWPQEEVLPGLVHIHGTADRVLPLFEQQNLIKIPKGKHLMVMHNAREISAILNQILESE